MWNQHEYKQDEEVLYDLFLNIEDRLPKPVKYELLFHVLKHHFSEENKIFYFYLPLKTA
jgi:hypothetical protein